MPTRKFRYRCGDGDEKAVNDAPVRRAGEIAAHFAVLAGQRLDRCASQCPVCDSRDRSAQVLDSLTEDLEDGRRKLAETARAAGFENAADMRQWIEGEG